MKSIGLLLLRVAVGSMFAVHGYPKLFGGGSTTVAPRTERVLGQGFTQAMQGGGIGSFAKSLENMQVPAPMPSATLIGLLEFAGGAMLILGWFTRMTALLFSGEMAVAIQKVHWKNGMVGPGGFEFPFALLSASLALFFTGPGVLSVDGVSGGAKKLGERAEEITPD